MDRDWKAEYYRVLGEFAPSSRAGIIEEDDFCEDCSGSGYKLYGNTSTWRFFAVGGVAVTTDVCNKCWGSGSKTQPWPSHQR